MTTNHTDKELLELAAKAAGIKGKYQEWSPEPGQKNFGIAKNGAWAYWNPLTNDGDALRLAVKLKLALFTSEKWCEAIRSDIPVCAELPGEDPYAATRRAIVRAAAEVGKELP